MREVRSLISDPPPEGWLDNEGHMVYNTSESAWGSEGITNEEMDVIKQHHASKIPTNAGCIKQLYGHEEVDDPRVPDHIHYRRCKRPTTLEEVYRRWSFRLRRRAYFARPAVNMGGLWFPEFYLADPEDPEWSWKEGIEVDRPAQSLYQLNEGKVFWDPFKHLRVNGVHPYYRWPIHENCIQRQIPPNPIRHVKRPTEQFIKFSIEHFLYSHFTTREPPDCVQYHPLYSGFRPLGDGTTNDLVDLTKNYVLVRSVTTSYTVISSRDSNSSRTMFWPPENQEWFLSPTEPDTTEMKSDTVVNQQPVAIIVDDPFDTNKMLPYLSPTSLFAEEEEAVTRRTESSWGRYDTAANRRESLQRWQEQEGESEIDHTPKVSSTEVLQQPIVAEVSSPINTMAASASNSSGKYVIPRLSKQGFQSNRVNELATKVSPPARSILPKPPGSKL